MTSHRAGEADRRLSARTPGLHARSVDAEQGSRRSRTALWPSPAAPRGAAQRIDGALRGGQGFRATVRQAMLAHGVTMLLSVALSIFRPADRKAADGDGAGDAAGRLQQPRHRGEGQPRGDEIGAMSLAFAVYHQKMIESRSLAQQQAAQREQSEAGGSICCSTSPHSSRRTSAGRSRWSGGRARVDRSSADVTKVVGEISPAPTPCRAGHGRRAMCRASPAQRNNSPPG